MANPEPQQEYYYIIELEEWGNSLKKKARVAYQNLRVGACTILKVPRRIRKQDPGAYEPKNISLGPYHHREPCLQAMKELKLNFLWLFLQRYSRVALQDYLRALKTLEKKARSSYSEDIHMESNEFVEMLLLDGCFVVEFLLQFVERRYRHPFFKTLGASNSIINDMLMLENQLPFFVLESICYVAKCTKSFKHLAFHLCKSLFPNGVRMPSEESVPRFHHLLHFLHSCIAPTQPQQQNNAQSSAPTPISIPRATLLAEAGVKFRTAEEKGKSFFDRLHLPRFLHSGIAPTQHQQQNNACPPPPPPPPPPPQMNRCSKPPPETRVNIRTREMDKMIRVNFRTTEEDRSFRNEDSDFCLLDITFMDGVLSIPTLTIYDETNLLFRNLIAFEQCFPAAGNHVAAYSDFMDFIIDTPTDVALLRQKQVIVNCLGSDEDVAVLFNNLCKEVVINTETGYLSDVFKNVTRYHSSRRHRYWQKFMDDHFNSPWSIISLVAAVILLLLAATQAAFSVLPYFKAPK